MNMYISDSTSRRLRLLSTICAAFVVFIHTPCELSRGSLAYNVFFRMFNSLQSCAVPLFFAMSGGFAALTLSRQSSDLKSFWLKKARTLLVPFFLLNFLVCMIGYAEILCDIHFGFSARLGDISVESFLRAFGFGKTRSPILGALWYVRCLFLLMLVAPFINKMIMRFRKCAIGFVLVLVSMCIVWIALGCRYPVMDPLGYWMSPVSILYFTVGMFWAHLGFVLPSRKWGLLVFIPLVDALLMKFMGIPEFAKGCLIHFVDIPCAALAIAALVPHAPPPQWLTRNSFGIYVFHTTVLHFICMLLKRVGLLDSIYTVPWYVAIGSVAFVVALCLSEFIHRKLPRLVPFLFGGR